ncbi:MAG: hypothetical protein J1D85_08275, partial [Bacteroidales bacterium]|nr:hypothetical protein [Bacteroidales bacterium]
LDEAEYAGMSGEQKAQYREAMRRDWDYKNTIDFAHDKGFEEGLAEGQRTIAKKLLTKGLPIELVAAGTGLTIEYVRELADESDKA